jgi:hypothetical protein
VILVLIQTLTSFGILVLKISILISNLLLTYSISCYFEEAIAGGKNDSLIREQSDYYVTV